MSMHATATTHLSYYNVCDLFKLARHYTLTVVIYPNKKQMFTVRNLFDFLAWTSGSRTT